MVYGISEVSRAETRTPCSEWQAIFCLQYANYIGKLQNCKGASRSLGGLNSHLSTWTVFFLSTQSIQVFYLIFQFIPSLKITKEMKAGIKGKAALKWASGWVEKRSEKVPGILSPTSDYCLGCVLCAVAIMHSNYTVAVLLWLWQGNHRMDTCLSYSWTGRAEMKFTLTPEILCYFYFLKGHLMKF